MDGFVKIDKSIARGFFNQELRATDAIARGSNFEPDALDIERVFFEHIFTRIGGKFSIPLHAFKSAARKMASHRLRSCERLFSINHKVVPGSDRKSFIEAAFRNRPSIDDDILVTTVTYVYAKRDRLVMVKKASPLAVTGHAMRRYLQRGDGVSLSDKVLVPLLEEILAREGLFVFLANVAGRCGETTFAVPFREGFLLCLLSEVQSSAAVDYVILTKDDMDLREEDGPASIHVHPLGWENSGRKRRYVISAMTFVGRNEMKEGQVALHDLVEGIYQRTKKEIGLLSDLDGVFYPGHNLSLLDSLDAAAPRLDRATKDLAAALSWDRKLSFAFTKRDHFDAAGVDLPSEAIRMGREGATRYLATSAAFGILERGGGQFCHLPMMGLYDAPKGISCLDAEEAFSADPYVARTSGSVGFRL